MSTHTSVEPGVSSEVERLRDDKLAHYWPAILEQLDLIQNEWEPWWTKESLWEDLLFGRLQLWAAGFPDCIEVCVVTHIVMFPAGNVMECVLAFGHNIEFHLPALAASLECEARRRNCHMITIRGRRGWARKLLAWRPIQERVLLVFEVSKEGVH